MAEGIGPIASAVIIPEPEAPLSPPLKRRQSPTPSEQHAKRARLSHDGSNASPTAAAPPSSVTIKREDQDVSVRDGRERRKSSAVEEKKRGRRLFGGLLNTLSQSTANGQQKRRSEIERRQVERAQKQKVEDEGRVRERLEALREVRLVEQGKWEREVMRTKHANLRATAGFLSTETSPKLYFKPWELRPEQEERIKAQILETEEQIEREEQEFHRRHGSQLGEDPLPEKNNAPEDSKKILDEPTVPSPVVPDAPILTAGETSDIPAPEQAREAEKNDTEAFEGEKSLVEENNGEVVVVNEEDTVIY